MKSNLAPNTSGSYQLVDNSQADIFRKYDVMANSNENSSQNIQLGSKFAARKGNNFDLKKYSDYPVDHPNQSRDTRQIYHNNEQMNQFLIDAELKKRGHKYGEETNALMKDMGESVNSKYFRFEDAQEEIDRCHEQIAR